MNARQLRRAQERKARKLARQTATGAVAASVASAPVPRAEINRQNARHATGPKSVPGKAKSSLNAVKTGLTGATVLLPSDDVAAYERHITSSFAAWRPETDRERVLVQSIADTEWRLLRIPSLESGIYALGHIEFADAVEEYDAALRPGMIEVKTFLKYERQLRNLHLQESRLQRRREKEIAELRALQQERKNAEQTLPSAANGFVFSTDKVAPELPPAGSDSGTHPDMARAA